MGDYNYDSVSRDDGENSMSENGWGTHSDYYDDRKRRVDRIIENFDGHVWENRERNRRNKGY